MMAASAANLNFSRPREQSRTTSLSSSTMSSDQRLLGKEHPTYVDYINIELDPRLSPINVLQERPLPSPPPAYRLGDRRRSRFSSLLRSSHRSTLGFRNKVLAEKSNHLDILHLLHCHGLRDLERGDWKRLHELSLPEEREAYLRLVKEGWDFSGYYGVLFSSLETVSRISGRERGEAFLRKTEDGWRDGRGLPLRTGRTRREKRKRAEFGSFVRDGDIEGSDGVVRAAGRYDEDLSNGRFNINLEHVLGAQDRRIERRSAGHSELGLRPSSSSSSSQSLLEWTRCYWFRMVLVLIFFVLAVVLVGMFIRVQAICSSTDCIARRMNNGGAGNGSNNNGNGPGGVVAMNSTMQGFPHGRRSGPSLAHT